MKRLVLALAAASLIAGVLPGLASATEIQVGATTTALVAPTCPTEVATATETVTEVTETDCLIVLAKTTALENISDGVASPDLITTPGLIDSFTLGVSGLVIPGAALSSELTTLDDNWGGAPTAQLTVLRPVAGSSASRWAVAAQSPVIPLRPYLGKIAEFPLIAPIPVVRGEALAITVPTWAPILSLGLSDTNFSYSQSHTQILTGTGTSQKSSCDTSSASSLAQVTLGQQALYTCSYQGTRVEYSALEVPAAGTAAAVRTHRESARRKAKRPALKRHKAARKKSTRL